MRILRRAEERYIRGRRVELATVAAEEGVSRATAYRWFGDNDRLLAEVLSERVRKNFRRLIGEHADKIGRKRVLGVIEGFLRRAATSERLEMLLQREPNRTLRILASGAYNVQKLEVKLVESLLAEEQIAGNLDLVVSAHTMAFGIIRLLETYLYADVIAGEKRDINSALLLVGLLLSERATEGRSRD